MISLFTFPNFFTHILINIILISTIFTNTITYLNNSSLDREQALLLAEASIQAYNVMEQDDTSICHLENVTPPSGYDVVECWSGVDQVFNRDKKVEAYGVVFRSEQSPYNYIFAFRGTDSEEDLLLDFDYNLTHFTPYQSNTSLPLDVQVEAGFYGIYTDNDLDMQTKSMREQLFALLNQYQTSPQPINQLYVTGHSLGAALSQLFTLDLALSRPNIKASNYNYASPRVGNNQFVDFYEQQIIQNNSHARTIRIQNIRDRVPCVPLPEEGYKHLSYAYLVDFYKDDWVDLDFIVDNHSILNYKQVLDCSLSRENGICVNDRQQSLDDDYTIKFQKPNPRLVCNLW